jgi:hypothetical protein
MVRRNTIKEDKRHNQSFGQPTSTSNVNNYCKQLSSYIEQMGSFSGDKNSRSRNNKKMMSNQTTTGHGHNNMSINKFD